jgi:hypothetical protein
MSDAECSECSKEKQTLQRSPASEYRENRKEGEIPSIVSEVLNSPGQPLDAEVQAYFEPRFGYDFSRVRVHADDRAAASAQAVNALAYAVGHNIVFGAGQFALDTVAGNRLMAHELSHVVQQGGAHSATHPALQRQVMDTATSESTDSEIDFEQSSEAEEEELEFGPSTADSNTDDEVTSEGETEEEKSPEEELPSFQAKPIHLESLHNSSSALQHFELEADKAADSIIAGGNVHVNPGVVGLVTVQGQKDKSKGGAKVKKPTKPKVCGRPSARVSDFPKTYISDVNVDLTSPNHSVSLVWTGPNAASGKKGPFHSSPGAGLCNKNCADKATSTTGGSLCTPIGSFKVTNNSACALGSFPKAKNPTYFQRPGVALHFWSTVPNHPASHGCVRLAALSDSELVHDNSLKDVTNVNVSGTWRRGTIKIKKKVKDGKKSKMVYVDKPVCYKK